VTVLTHTHWPLALTIVPCTLPATMTTAFERFRSYYLRRYAGRRLVVHPTLGTADVRAVFPRRRHELQVPTAMAAVLVLFNDRDRYTYAVRTRPRGQKDRERDTHKE
jgi:hypothetical protein